MLIGREAEIAAIARLVAGARVGRSGVLVLTGEAGIGKTSLIEQARTLSENMRVLRAAGTASERDVGFAGLLALLRPALGGLDLIPERHAEALAVAFALREGASGDRFAVGAASLSLLSRFAEEQPVLVLVDDAHQLDRPSAEALLFVARRLMADRVAVLVTSRPEPGTAFLESGLPEMEVVGLTVDSVAGLLALHAGTAVSSEMATRLHRATRGNPLAVVELAGSLDELERMSPQTPVPVPTALARAFTRRVNDQPKSTQLALLLVAITDGDLAVMSRAAGTLGTAVADLADAEAAGLVRLLPGRAEFYHPLVRSSVYAAATPDLRRRAHRSVAHALPPGDLERRAWNLCEATVGVDDEVGDLVEVVARRARDRSAPDVAATAFERAALLASDERRRTERFVAAGESAWLAGQRERAESLLRHASRGPQDPSLTADVDGLRGSIAARAGSLEEAHRLLVVAAEKITATDPDGAALLLGDAINACFYLGATDRAFEIATTLEGLLAGATTHEARIRGSLAVGMAHVLAGRPGIDRIRDAVDEMSRSTGWRTTQRRPAWEILGALFLRESDTGRMLVRRTVEDLRANTALGTLPTVLFYVARDDATTDRWQSAAAGYQEAIDLARETGETTDLVVCLAGLAWLQARMGRETDCRTNADEAIVVGRTHHVHLGVAWATFALGDLDLGLGRPARAVGHLERLVAMLDHIGLRDVDLSPGPELAEALQRLGRLDEARRAALSYHANATSKGQPWACARAERAMAITARDDTMTTHFDNALELHRSSLDTFEEARTRLVYGGALRRRRQRVAARPLLRSALETFERLDAKPWAETAAGELDAAGETPRPRGGSRLDTLTAQELQIARRLGSGQTTREAAAAMFLSPKTVEYHLRHAYTKLGIRSRSELTSLLTAEQSVRPSQP